MPVYTYYTTFDDCSQGTITTDAWGINGSGQIVGYPNVTGVYGFLYSGGTYTNPQRSVGTAGTWAGRRADSSAAAGDHDLGVSATAR